MNRYLSIFVALIASCLPALAQTGTPIKQSGNVTPGHALAWTTNGIAQDAGTAAVPFLTSIGTVGQGQTICAWTALSTAPGSQKLCLGVFDASAATITLQNYGIDSPQGLNFVINGTTYPFPYTVGGIVGPGTTVAGDFAEWNNTVGTLLKDVTPTAAIDQLCSTNTDFLQRAAGTWGCGSTLPWSSITSTPTTIAGYGITNARTQLSGNLVEYVNGNASGTATCGPAGAFTCAAGVDTGKCLTPATACLTLQYTHNLIIGNVDFAYQYGGTIYLSHNTGTTNYALSSINGPWIGTSVINIVGDSSAGASATVIQDPIGAAGLACKDLCTLSLSHLTYADNGTNNGAAHITVGGSGNAAHIDLNDVIFATINNSGTMVSVNSLASLTLNGPITISGGGGIAFQVNAGGFLDFGAQTVTVSGTPAFAVSFAYMLNGGAINATNTTFSGSATGLKCIALGSINLGGYDPNGVFPGNSNCVGNELIGAIGIQNGSTFGYGTAGQALISGGGATTKDSWGTLGYVGGGTNATTLAGAQANFEMPKVITSATSVNFNSVADTALAFTMPSGYTRVSLDYITISNASHTLTTAQFGVFGTTGGSAPALIASATGITVSATSDATANNTQATNGIPTISAIAASLATPNTIYFRVTNAEGAAATGDVTAVLRCMP